MKGPDEFPWSPFHEFPSRNIFDPHFSANARLSTTPVSVALLTAAFAESMLRTGTRNAWSRLNARLRFSTHLVTQYGADSVQFYDMNFFLKEDHALELAKRIEHLNLRWWCEARVDIMSRYSDKTFEALKRAGCTMIFFGAESGSDWALKEMKKGITTDQTITMAERIKKFGIIPEFSFVIGNPGDPERDTRETLAFIRKLKTNQSRL